MNRGNEFTQSVELSQLIRVFSVLPVDFFSVQCCTVAFTCISRKSNVISELNREYSIDVYITT